MNIEPIFNITVEHGESPVWCARTQQLYWVDLLQGKYIKANYNTKEIKVFSVGQPIGVLAILENSNNLVMAVRDGFGFYDEEKNSFQLIEPSPEKENRNTRFNDGAIDPAGRFFAGTMEWNGAKNQGKLFSLNTDKSWNLLDENYHIPNGMGWSINHKTFFLIDSNQHALFAFDYNIKTGSISNKRVHIQFSENEIPDGMAMDVDNGFWIAMWGSSKVSHYNSKGKKVIDIPMPIPYPTSCCFGGNNLTDLFVTSSQLILSKEEKEKYPLSGSIFKIETKTKGFEQRKFKA